MSLHTENNTINISIGYIVGKGVPIKKYKWIKKH